ncbi:MAG: T9SS type A sorting domain-containing protein, partial [Bacteroidales bacterium]|nr:T9SS type A sorting domain-containing protein [Bacteroidales bacterium]
KYNDAISNDVIFHYPNIEDDDPVLPQMNNMLESYEYYQVDTNNNLIFVQEYIFTYEDVVNNDEPFVSEDFEDYTVGDNLAETSINEFGKTWWTTWSQTPGSSEDAFVASVNDNNCVKIVYGNDLVLLFGEITEGVYDVELDVMVPDGGAGYFNLLHNFDVWESTWAMQSFLQMVDDGNDNIYISPNHGTLHAGSNGTADIPCVYDEWMHFRINIDMYRDVAAYYYTMPGEDEVKACEWKWSLDSFGKNTYGSKLHAMNLYAPIVGTEFYVDNISLTTLIEYKEFWTTYDLQSNANVSNRMYQKKNGDVVVVSTQSHEYNETANDRGTGYNIYDGEGWTLPSGSREEANATGADMRTGWPSIAPYGPEGEILVNHSNGLNYYIREKAGEGQWDGPYSIPAPILDGREYALSWPRVTTSGENNDIIHIACASQYTEDYTGNNITVQFYCRSTDGVNWEVGYSPLAETNEHINIYSADDYSISSNGDVVAICYASVFYGHVLVYKSTDNGQTWERMLVWENPYYGNWETDENTLTGDTPAQTPVHSTCVVGPDGTVHVAFSIADYTHRELGTSFNYYYGRANDGIAYWNDTREPLTNIKLWTEDSGYSVHSMDSVNFCGWMPFYENIADFNADAIYRNDDYIYQYYGSSSGFPALSVDPSGNLAMAYSTIDTERDLDTYYGHYYYRRSVYVSYKKAGEEGWNVAVENLMDQLGFEASHAEANFVNAVGNSVKEDEFYFSFVGDDIPGFYFGSGASQYSAERNDIYVVKYEPDGDIDEPIINHWTVDPNLYANNMSLIGLVQINGINQYSTAIEVGAFCGEEVRGSQLVQYIPNLDKYFVFLTVHGNDNDEISFKLYNHSSKKELDLRSPEAITFTTNSTFGSIESPYILNFRKVVNITANVNPEIAGTVSGTGEYAINDTVTLTATANEGFSFMNWTVNGEVVSTNSEYSFTVTRTKELVANFCSTQSTELKSGWNWFSSYIEISGTEGLEIIEDALGENGLLIKSQKAFVANSSIGWQGTLTEFDVRNMYMIQTSNDTTLTLIGDYVNPEEHPITIGTNWRWISYPVSESISVEEALATINPSHGDYIKSHTSFSQYYEETGWIGGLNTMNPGEGYMYQNTSGTTKTLVYPTSASKGTKANVTSESNYWIADAGKYSDNMSLIAFVQNNENSDYEIAAFVGDEVRGSARPIYIESLDRYMIFMTIYGEKNEEISFRYCDLSTEMKEDVFTKENVIFSSNATYGSIDNPIAMMFDTEGLDENGMENVSIYPNPADVNSEINLGMTCDRVEIYNVLGVKIAEYSNVNKIDGMETSGIYIIKVMNDNEMKNCRIVVE